MHAFRDTFILRQLKYLFISIMSGNFPNAVCQYAISRTQRLQVPSQVRTRLWIIFWEICIVQQLSKIDLNSWMPCEKNGKPYERANTVQNRGYAQYERIRYTRIYTLLCAVIYQPFLMSMSGRSAFIFLPLSPHMEKRKFSSTIQATIHEELRRSMPVSLWGKRACLSAKSHRYHKSALLILRR